MERCSYCVGVHNGEVSMLWRCPLRRGVHFVEVSIIMERCKIMLWCP